MVASHISRRRILRDGIALGALGLAGFPTTSAFAAPAATPKLPARGNLVIRNAYVMTMDTAGDLPDADVHVRDGVIVAVGPKLKAPGASVIEAHGMIVLPGLVETHWHMWNTLLRSMSGEKPEFGYFRTTAAIGQGVRARRHVSGHAARGGRGDQFRHHLRARLVPQHPRRRLCGRRSARARARPASARASPTAPRRAWPNSAGIALADLRRLHRDWAKYSNDGLISLGLAWRGMGGNNPATAIPPEIYKAEIEAGRDLGLPMSVHASGSRPAIGQIAHHREGRPARQGHADHPRQHGDARGDRGARQGRGASVSMSPYHASCASASACRRSASSSRRAFRSGCRSTPSSFRAMPTCSAS